MQLCKITDGGAEISFTNAELILLQNALNEVCHGLDVPEFATRLGVERAEAERLLNEIHSTTEGTTDRSALPR